MLKVKWDLVATQSKLDRDSALRAFVDGYIECALWACSAEMSAPGIMSEGDGNDRSFDDWGYDSDALSDEARLDILTDCIGFWTAERASLALALEEWDASDLGHDFHLSRNGHGTGFWDRGRGALGGRLHDAAKVYGTQGLVWNGSSIDTHG